jgi:hypothetical protein
MRFRSPQLELLVLKRFSGFHFTAAALRWSPVRKWMIARLMGLSALVLCSLLAVRGRAEVAGTITNQLDDTASADRGFANGTSGDKVLAILGQPSKISLQILLGRHLEQWTYAEPIGLRIELRGVRGQELHVGSVHSLRSKKP